MYFYLRSQFNRGFRLEGKHLVHLLPWTMSFLFYFVIFIQGPDAVQSFQNSRISEISIYVGWIILMISYTYYFYHSFLLYGRYREWSPGFFSDTDSISFSWFRNFMILMALWISVRELTKVLSLFIDLSFYQDWWWNLFLVAVVIYTGLSGFTQIQKRDLSFDPEEEDAPIRKPLDSDPSYLELADKLKEVMKHERLYLQPDLTLSVLAKHLNVNHSNLSASINNVFGRNYNDYINELRINEFEKIATDPKFDHYSLLAMAYEAGFNSKATFYRSFRKVKGISPKEYLSSRVSDK